MLSFPKRTLAKEEKDDERKTSFSISAPKPPSLLKETLQHFLLTTFVYLNITSIADTICI